MTRRALSALVGVRLLLATAELLAGTALLLAIVGVTLVAGYVGRRAP